MDMIETELYNAFSQYGEVKEVSIIPDKQSGMNRCFGFVKFESESSIDEVMKNYYEVRVRGNWVKYII